jgi:hypothetical protein
LRIQFTSNLDYRDFPFDNHRVVITLANGAASPDDMMFDVKKASFIFNDAIYTASWRYQKHVVFKGYSYAELDKDDANKHEAAPQVQIIMDFKGGWRKLFIIFVPLFLLSFLSAFALILTKDQIFLSLGSISGLLAHRFVIESMSPTVGYFTVSDRLYIWLLIFSFLFFLINISGFISGNRLEGLKDTVFILSLIGWPILTYSVILKAHKSTR